MSKKKQSKKPIPPQKNDTVFTKEDFLKALKKATRLVRKVSDGSNLRLF